MRTSVVKTVIRSCDNVILRISQRQNLGVVKGEELAELLELMAASDRLDRINVRVNEFGASFLVILGPLDLSVGLDALQ